MNNPSPDSRLDSLFTQARAHRADTSRAEYGFETRLLAQLRAQRQASASWTLVSWRLIPFFATGLLALALCQSALFSGADEAEQIVTLQSPEAVDLWNTFN